MSESRLEGRISTRSQNLDSMVKLSRKDEIEMKVGPYIANGNEWTHHTSKGRQKGLTINPWPIYVGINDS